MGLLDGDEVGSRYGFFPLSLSFSLVSFFRLLSLATNTDLVCAFSSLVMLSDWISLGFSDHGLTVWGSGWGWVAWLAWLPLWPLLDGPVLA